MPSPETHIKTSLATPPCISHHLLSFSSNPIVCHSSFFLFLSLFSLFFLPHHSDLVLSMWCSLSAFHSLLLLLHLQSHCLSFTLLSFSFSFLSSSLHRFSDVNVLFTFSISLIAFAPSSPMSFPVFNSSFSFSSLFSFFLTTQI